MDTDPFVLFISSDMTWTLPGVKNAVSGAFLNAGTCTYILKKSDGTTVTGGTGSLSYVSGSDGDYRGTIESTVTTLLKNGDPYWLEVTFAEGGLDRFWRLPCVAQYDTQ